MSAGSIEILLKRVYLFAFLKFAISFIEFARNFGIKFVLNVASYIINYTRVILLYNMYDI